MSPSTNRFARKHWSYSALNQYLRCPLQYLFERELCLPQPTISSSLVLGASVHEGLATFHTRLMNGEPAASADVFEKFLETWRQKEGERGIAYKAGETKESAVEQGLALLAMYLQEPAPTNIVAVESLMVAPIANSRGEYLEKPIYAIVDLVTENDGGLKINEFKTASKALSVQETELALQPTFYLNVAQELFAKPASVEYTVLVKTKQPKVQRVTTTRPSSAFGRLGDLIESVQRAVDADAFYPVENAMNCSGCPYRKPCKDWTAASQPIEPIEITLPTEAPAC